MTGMGSSHSNRLLFFFFTIKTGSQRFREPQLPSYTPGVQLANKEPPQCFQAGMATAPKTPFRNTSPTKRFETRSDSSTELESSEDCLFLKYIFIVN